MGWRDVLRNEFEAGDDSFLITMRCGYEWDREAFSRLVAAMKQCCDETAEEDAIERWLADGFWYLSHIVRGTTQHPAFRRPYPAEYYEAAYVRLEDLASYFFSGHSPYLDGYGFDPL